MNNMATYRCDIGGETFEAGMVGKQFMDWVQLRICPEHLRKAIEYAARKAEG
jgi:hypothetical protein